MVQAVRGLDLEINQGAVHGLVGESGCGKTVTAKSIMRLHDERFTHYSGEIVFHEQTQILKMKPCGLEKLRGQEIAMVFQDPFVSLNPLYTVGEQIAESLRRHKKMTRRAAYKYTLELLERVGIHPADKRYAQYPFEFSGGMLQRVMIAIAVSCEPRLLIADEPTTALDVTIQAQILELFKDLQQSLGMSILFITHNFGVVAEICEYVSVMYAGRIVETADVQSIFNHPGHPYTRALLESIPKTKQRGSWLPTIAGSPPDLCRNITGCPFAPRCEYAGENCFLEAPGMVRRDGHEYACHVQS